MSVLKQLLDPLTCVRGIPTLSVSTKWDYLSVSVCLGISLMKKELVNVKKKTRKVIFMYLHIKYLYLKGMINEPPPPPPPVIRPASSEDNSVNYTSPILSLLTVS